MRSFFLSLSINCIGKPVEGWSEERWRWSGFCHCRMSNAGSGGGMMVVVAGVVVVVVVVVEMSPLVV